MIPYIKSIEPLIFKSKWRTLLNEKLKNLSYLEYKLLKYTDKEIYNEIENLTQPH